MDRGPAFPSLSRKHASPASDTLTLSGRRASIREGKHHAGSTQTHGLNFRLSSSITIVSMAVDRRGCVCPHFLIDIFRPFHIPPFIAPRCRSRKLSCFFEGQWPGLPTLAIFYPLDWGVAQSNDAVDAHRRLSHHLLVSSPAAAFPFRFFTCSSSSYVDITLVWSSRRLLGLLHRLTRTELS